MQKQYVYHRSHVLFFVGAFAFCGAIGFGAMLSLGYKPEAPGDWLFYIAVLSVPFFMLAISVFFIYYILSIKIIIDDHGLDYKSLRKKYSIKWAEIESITRTNIISGGWLSNFQIADLIIKAKGNRVLKILFALQSGDLYSPLRSIKDLENKIVSHSGVEVKEEIRRGKLEAKLDRPISFRKKQ